MTRSHVQVVRVLFFVSVALFTTSCFTITKEKEEETRFESDVEDDNEVEISIDSENGEDVKINIDMDDPANALKNMAEKMEDFANKLQENEEGEGIEVVNFRELKELLPNRVAGMKLDDSSGETSGALGFKMSTAEGEYRDGDQSIDISIVDIGGMPLALMGVAAWSTMEFERDSDDGYERTTTFEGHKAFEKYDSDRENGEMAVLINNRFVVSVKGRNVSERDLKSALRKVDLDELEDLSGK